VTVRADRWACLVTALAARQGAELTVAGMCSSAADVLLVVPGTSIVVASGDGTLTGPTYSSAVTVAALEEVHFTLGVGPGSDAYNHGVPIIQTDLVANPPARWLGFTGPALDAGVQAVFSFPLQVGAARIGALTLYRNEPGPLDDDRYQDAAVMAGIITGAVLAMQAGAVDGLLGAGMSDGGGFHAKVHQASGIVSVQLEIDVGEALVRLRAHAFAETRTVSDVAADVISRRLQFQP